jgi:hypothetical protein
MGQASAIQLGHGESVRPSDASSIMTSPARREHLRAYLIEAMRDNVISMADIGRAPSVVAAAIAADLRAVGAELLATGTTNALRMLADQVRGLADSMGKR